MRGLQHFAVLTAIAKIGLDLDGVRQAHLLEWYDRLLPGYREVAQCRTFELALAMVEGPGPALLELDASVVDPAPVAEQDHVAGRGGGRGGHRVGVEAGRDAAVDLVLLADDRGAIPPYDALVLASARLQAGHPEVIDAVRSLAGSIDAGTMRRMNLAVDQDGRSPGDVAREFLDGRWRESP